MSNTRHVVVLRKDLLLPPGLAAAQTAHASDQFIRDRILKKRHFTVPELEWMKEPYITVLAVQCLDELEIIRDDAKKQGLQVHEWYDIIVSPTLSKKIRTLVAISIGPDDSDRLALVTSILPLY